LLKKPLHEVRFLVGINDRPSRLLRHNAAARQNVSLIRFHKTAIVVTTLAGRRDICGADCDLIVDGCLIDLKTALKTEVGDDTFEATCRVLAT
jgi:hypothetical protein